MICLSLLSMKSRPTQDDQIAEARKQFLESTLADYKKH